jgi:hypothetical protein
MSDQIEKEGKVTLTFIKDSKRSTTSIEIYNLSILELSFLLLQFHNRVQRMASGKEEEE